VATTPTVLMIAPGYPPEMPYFVRGLAETGSRVLGLGDSPESALPPTARHALSGHLHVRTLWDERAVLDALRAWPPARSLDRIECLWEPAMLLAAGLREALGLPGMTVAETLPFRDKETMKQRLDRAGIRTPRHRRARTAAEVRSAAEEIGYPLIVKPIAGAGSADTHRVDDPEALERVLRATAHVVEASVEEFVEAEEFTFDTICSGGRILYHNVSWYRPRPLEARQDESVSSQTIALRDVSSPYVAGGVAMGPKVLEALGFRDGFTHMEWFRRPDGEAVFGEIAARAPGARSTEVMNYACDLDVWRAWAEAVVHGRISQPIERKFNAGIVFKRARGPGRIRRVEGLEAFLAEFGRHVVSVDLLPVGAARRDWRQTLLSDGWIVVRHPDLQATLRMTDRIASDVNLYASP
jgi:hypothetical protein